MLMNSKLKQRFCKNYNIPINLFTEPYFTSRIELYDKYYGTIDKYNDFKTWLSLYNNDEDYFAEYNKVKELAINSIKNSVGYNKFITDDMTKYTVVSSVRNKNIYSEDNIGKKLMSIDMVTANFTALSIYDDSMIDKKHTYEDWIRQFTIDESIISSKYIRQVIFGACNPKRQVVYEKYLMSQVLTTLCDASIINSNSVIFFGNDELVCDITDYDMEALSSHINKDGIYFINIGKYYLPCHIDIFTLDKVNEAYIKKSLLSHKYKIKCASPEEIPFILRKLNNEEIHDDDLYFYYQGKLAKFVIPKETV